MPQREKEHLAFVKKKIEMQEKRLKLLRKSVWNEEHALPHGKFKPHTKKKNIETSINLKISKEMTQAQRTECARKALPEKLFEAIFGKVQPVTC